MLSGPIHLVGFNIYITFSNPFMSIQTLRTYCNFHKHLGLCTQLVKAVFESSNEVVSKNVTSLFPIESSNKSMESVGVVNDILLS